MWEHHLLCFQPTFHSSHSAGSQSSTGIPRSASLSHMAYALESLYAVIPNWQSHMQISIMCPEVSRVAKGFPLLFFERILKHVCTVPQKVPAGLSVLTTLVACSVLHSWIVLLFKFQFLFPRITSKKQKKSVLGFALQRESRVKQGHHVTLWKWQENVSNGGMICFHLRNEMGSFSFQRQVLKTVLERKPLAMKSNQQFEEEKKKKKSTSGLWEGLSIQTRKEKRGKETDLDEGMGPTNIADDLGPRKEMASRWFLWQIVTKTNLMTGSVCSRVIYVEWLSRFPQILSKGG